MPSLRDKEVTVLARGTRAVRPTCARISLAALRRNYRRLRAVVPAATRMVGVVKAEAYGHGAVEVARTLVAEGVDALAVALVEEAWVLRQAGVTVPLVLLASAS